MLLRANTLLLKKKATSCFLNYNTPNHPFLYHTKYVNLSKKPYKHSGDLDSSYKYPFVSLLLIIMLVFVSSPQYSAQDQLLLTALNHIFMILLLKNYLLIPDNLFSL